jgi:exosortase D (VPLPA-CTERM-specific)
VSSVLAASAPLPRSLYLSRVLWLLLAALLVVLFRSGLLHTVGAWGTDEYSHGWLIPPLAAYLIWRQRQQLARLPYAGSWLGVAILLLGVLGAYLGELSTLGTVIEYSFIVSVLGTLLAVWGPTAMRCFARPLILLVLMVPLPNFIYFNLSQQLQLLSSQIGVWFIKLAGISVYLEGNVIDLGEYKLQVVEACSGLRYLFPLVTIGVIVAMFFRARWWQRALLPISTLPITILMNSFRIAVVGVLVDINGPGAATGFLHYFEGWVIFLACFGMLLLEMWLLLRVAGDRRTLRAALEIDAPAARPPATVPRAPAVPAPAWAALALLAVAVIPTALIPDRVELQPARQEFAEFPLQLGEWHGQRQRLEDQYVEALKFSDYLLGDYRHGGDAVNLYVAYYASQRTGESVHSPRACLPGGGWVIEEFGQRELQGAAARTTPLVVNRVVISHGSERELVYYWFQERGRVMSNEYLVKWYLFWDSLTRNRSDGALVRLITPLPRGDAARADAVLQEFARASVARLGAYLPD